MIDTNSVEGRKIDAFVFDTVAKMRIFFGHMSVGNQILNEIQRLSDEKTERNIHILKTRSADDFISPVVGHSTIGRNQFPFEKIDDFVSVLDNGVGKKIDIAIFKFCYTDIRVQTDVDSLFNYYQQRMKYLQGKYPKIRFIHFTVPIMVRSTGIKGLVKRLTGYDHNKNRNRLNEYIRKTYTDDCVFDIAFYESRYPDGSFEKYGRRNRIPGLVPKYSTDGGHLNETGKLLIAEEFLYFLVFRKTE